jgi:AraC family transcriptional activator of pobA
MSNIPFSKPAALSLLSATEPLASPLDIVATGRFNVYPREVICNRTLRYSRRDFYKVSLLQGTSQFLYATRGVLIDRPALVFSSPLIPYAWEPIAGDQRGYVCLFTEEFLLSHDRPTSLQESPLFKVGTDPVFFLDEMQYADFERLFQKMHQELHTGYLYKEDLVRTYLNLLLHEALKMQPQTTYFKPPNAATRIVSLFQDLLERQFPIESPDRGLTLRTPKDFATRLSVHVNHLNKAVRELTQKTTGQHIADRLIAEAKALLQHTSWSTAEIAYSLGFEYPTYFNNFFKKHTGTTPSALRGLLE